MIDKNKLISCLPLCPNWVSNPQHRYMPWPGIEPATTPLQPDPVSFKRKRQLEFFHALWTILTTWICLNKFQSVKKCFSYFRGNTEGPGIYGQSKSLEISVIFLSFSSVLKLSQGDSYGYLISSEGIVLTRWYGGQEGRGGDQGSNCPPERKIWALNVWVETNFNAFLTFGKRGYY